MSAFVSWILGILAVVIIGTILDIFLSEKKLGKSIRSVIASLVVLMIISPLPVLMSSLKSCTFDSGEVRLDNNFLEYANAQKTKALERGVEQAFADKGYKNIKVQITAQIGTEIEISQVKVYLADLVIEGQASNINKNEKIREMAAEFLKIGKEKVLIFD